MKHPILLASGSPRRAYLLEQLDIKFRIVVSDVEEIIPDNMQNRDVPEYLARLKGSPCLEQLQPGEILLAADTVVVFENTIIGKPQGKDEAAEILKQLSGNKHTVISGVFLSNKDKSLSFSVRTEVVFDVLKNEEIDYYINTYKTLDKAGAYGIQDWIGWSKIKRISGSYSNIMGLPTREVYQALADF